jgi:hypothetical protein
LGCIVEDNHIEIVKRHISINTFIDVDSPMPHASVMCALLLKRHMSRADELAIAVFK